MDVLRAEMIASVEAAMFMEEIFYLIGSVSPLGRSPLEAAWTLKDISKHDHYPVGHRDNNPKIKKAIRKVRDVLVMRIHLRVPPRHRPAFLEMLETVYEGSIRDEDKAAALLSYQKRLGGHPDAFPSKNHEVALRRGWKRGRRRRDIAPMYAPMITNGNPNESDEENEGYFTHDDNDQLRANHPAYIKHYTRK